MMYLSVSLQTTFVHLHSLFLMVLCHLMRVGAMFFVVSFVVQPVTAVCLVLMALSWLRFPRWLLILPRMVIQSLKKSRISFSRFLLRKRRSLPRQSTRVLLFYLRWKKRWWLLALRSFQVRIPSSFMTHTDSLLI